MIKVSEYRSHMRRAVLCKVAAAPTYPTVWRAPAAPKYQTGGWAPAAVGKIGKTDIPLYSAASGTADSATKHFDGSPAPLLVLKARMQPDNASSVNLLKAVDPRFKSWHSAHTEAARAVSDAIRANAPNGVGAGSAYYGTESKPINDALIRHYHDKMYSLTNGAPASASAPAK